MNLGSPFFPSFPLFIGLVLQQLFLLFNNPEIAIFKPENVQDIVETSRDILSSINHGFFKVRKKPKHSENRQWFLIKKNGFFIFIFFSFAAGTIISIAALECFIIG